jgi:hypothetical protein
MPNDHSLLVWVLDQTLGLLERSARTTEEQQAVKELRTLALLPKPDKAKLESLVHRLETMRSINPDFMRTPRTLKRTAVVEARPVRITLDRELNRLIESIEKKTGVQRTHGKKAGGRQTARKVVAKKPTRKVVPKKPTRKVAPKKTARKVAPKKPARKVPPKKPAATVARRKTATVTKLPPKKTRA